MTSSGATPEQLLSTARAYRPLPTAEGLVFASDLAGFSQTFRSERPGGWPLRLAATQQRLLPVGETPFGLLVRHDLDGNETWQLSLLQPEGELKPLTTDSRAIHGGVRLAPGGRRAALNYNPGGQRDFVLAVLDPDTGHIEDWAQPGGAWQFLGWHPDGQTTAVRHILRPTAAEVYLLEKGGEPRRILEEAGLVEDLLWVAGTRLAVTDLGSEFLNLVELDAQYQPARRLVDEGHDVRAVVADPAGERVAIAVNEGAYDSIRVLDVARGIEVARPILPRGLVYSDNTSDPAEHIAWRPDGASLFVAWESATSPAEIYEIREGAPPTRWTFAGGAPLRGLVEPVEMTYRSFDRLEIPALLYRSDDRPKPTVVYFHGGPESQSRGSFVPQVSSLVAAGFDVLAPNVRGSTGYGRHYFSMDDRERRWDSVRDGCEAARHLKRTGVATRVAAMGGSYGGFMTLAVLVEDPDLWDAGVDIVGIADWHTFFKNTSGWRRDLRAAEYGDPDQEPDATFLREFSPITRAATIKAALMVIHGRNDIRVPVSEAEQIARAVPGSELMIFDDEGHGITRHANRVKAYGTAIEFLRKRSS